MAIAFVGIGSNLGNKIRNIKKVLSMFEQHGIEIKKKSSLYETKPQEFLDQPKFINLAV